MRILFVRILGACVVMLTVAACDSTPTPQGLSSDLVTYLDRAYAPGLFEVVHTERLDHRVVPDFRRERRVVVYRADLKLKRAYDFGTWDQANAASLILLLGAAPKAVAGVNRDGNRSGDVLRVTGRLVYEQREGAWAITTGATDVAFPAAAPDRLALLKSWWDYTALTVDALFDDSVPRSNIVESAKTARSFAVREAGGIALAGGAEDSDAWNVLRSVAGTDPTILNVATTGAPENLALLRRGVVSAALLRADEAQLAAQGAGPFERDGTFPELRVLASLYPEKIHVVVDSKSMIASVAELFGKRVAFAGSSPAALNEASDILRAHRVELAALKGPLQQTPLNEAFAALARGDQDAVIFTAATPSAALKAFVGAHGLRLLPLDADAVALLTTGTSNYITATIPAQTYPGQDRKMTTVALAALLVSRADLAPREIQAVLQRTFAPRDVLKQGSPLSALVRLETSRQGLTLPLHPAAEAFYAPASAAK